MEDLYKVADNIVGYIVDTMKSFGCKINAKGFSDGIDCMIVFNYGDLNSYSYNMFRLYVRVVEGSVELWFEEFTNIINMLEPKLIFLFKNVTSLDDIKDKLTIKIMECVLLD